MADQAKNVDTSGEMMTTDTFALVTTCWNEISSIRDWISDVNGQTCQPDQIWIVDAGSTDGTLDVLRAWEQANPRVTVLVRERCNVAQGRNLAIGHASTTHIVSTDMGCRLDENWFHEIVAPFQTSSPPDVVAGNYAADISTVQSPAARAAFYMNDGYHPRLVAGFLPSSRSISYTKSMWKAMEGYPEDLTLAADDTVFALQFHRMGFKMGFAPKAMCYWRRHHQFKSYLKESFVYSRGNGEAGFNPPRGMRIDSPEYSKALCHIKAISCALTHNKRAYLKALKKFDFAAAAFLPLMTYGLIVKSYQGYSKGVARGIEHCISCRQRWM